MLNRSAVVIGHEAAFYGWLKTCGITDEAIHERKEITERAAYLFPACHHPEETGEVVEDALRAAVLCFPWTGMGWQWASEPMNRRVRYTRDP